MTFGGKDQLSDLALALPMEAIKEESGSTETQVSYFEFFANRRSMLSLTIGATSHMLLLYNSPTLANVIVDHGLSKGDAGFGIAICWTMYAIGGFLGGPICALMPRRYVTLITQILMVQAIVMIGPSQLLDLPDTIPIMFIGLGILGLAIGVLMVPMLPEIIEPVQLAHGIPLTGDASAKAA